MSNTERSTKTLGDLFDYADRIAIADLDELRKESDGNFYYVYQAERMAEALRDRCLEDYSCLNAEQLLPCARNAQRLYVEYDMIKYDHCNGFKSKPRPRYAIWACVHMFLDEHRKELGL